MVWEAKRIPVWIKGEKGTVLGPYILLVTRNALNPLEIKYFTPLRRKRSPSRVTKASTT
jgi:hypothetical protein